MTEGQALDYFNAALKHGGLCAGTNYMIDRDETVWECMVWAGGGIWYVKPTKRESTKEYHELRRYAAIQRRTTFEARTETPNALGEGRERGILREASSGEAATSTDGLGATAHD
jgi:hypothetical protein